MDIRKYFSVSSADNKQKKSPNKNPQPPTVSKISTPKSKSRKAKKSRDSTKVRKGASQTSETCGYSGSTPTVLNNKPADEVATAKVAKDNKYTPSKHNTRCHTETKPKKNTDSHSSRELPNLTTIKESKKRQVDLNQSDGPKSKRVKVKTAAVPATETADDWDTDSDVDFAAALEEAEPLRATPKSPKIKSPIKHSVPQKDPVSGKCFIVTGDLTGMTRDEAYGIIVKKGGRVVSAVSGKTDYLVAGQEPGVSKMAKAKASSRCQILNEDQLLNMLGIDLSQSEKMEEDNGDEDQASGTSKLKDNEGQESNRTETKASKDSKPAHIPSDSEDLLSLMWVDKYKPQSIKNVIGQTGDRSNAKRLIHWLNNWQKHKRAGTKPPPKFGHYGGDANGAGLHAALLSGPPGIGKTTTAVLACKETGYTFFELNASDARSKKILQELVCQALNNTSMKEYFTSTDGTGGLSKSQRHCVIMDEVDGMAGNEDRGGTQELIQMIKSTLTPIICICNNRNSPKIRSLANHCFDLRFQKPKTEQIKAAMMSVCFKEKVNIGSDSLNQIIEASNHDVRQVLHNLSVWSDRSDSHTSASTQPSHSDNKKDFKMDSFSACHLTFSKGPETAGMTLKDKADLFFYDYSLHPLFVQENYIHAALDRNGTLKCLKQLAKAASRIATGDVISKKIRSDKWALLPMQAMFSSALPGEHVGGSMKQRIEFPRWLGKFSSTNKQHRLVKEVSTHMSLSVTGTRADLNMDYMPVLRQKITTPLIIDGSGKGVQDVVQIMTDYELQRYDFDSILDLSQWKGGDDPRSRIQTKVKSAFTRHYNKTSPKVHYTTDVAAKKKTFQTYSPDMEEGAHEEEIFSSNESEAEEEIVNSLKVKPKKVPVKKTKPTKRKS